ncbi:MAG TPA: hypothetical protein VMV10_32195 [Pirellulales bacterium]|nr:hypothetical protein [Pirellulales bacterium]
MRELLTDLKILADAARDDHAKQRFASYGDYIAEFNRLLLAIEAETGDTGIERIESLPDGSFSMLGPGFGTNPEKQKLREIVRGEDLITSPKAIGSSWK